MNTKFLLGDTVEKLLNTIPLDKLTVKKIVDEAGVSKQTFYRNFEDKYCLANWQFLRDFFKSTSVITHEMTFEECMLCVYKGFGGRRTFLKNMFTSEDYNNLQNFVIFHMKDYIYGILELNGFDIKDVNLVLNVDTWIYGVLEITKRWILDDYDISEENLKKLFIETVPSCVKICFDRGNFFLPHPKM